LLIALCAFLLLQIVSATLMYIVQSAANSARSSVGHIGGLYLPIYARTLQTWIKYSIPILISRYFKIPIPNTEPSLKNTEKIPKNRYRLQIPTLTHGCSNIGRRALKRSYTAAKRARGLAKCRQLRCASYKARGTVIIRQTTVEFSTHLPNSVNN